MRPRAGNGNSSLGAGVQVLSPHSGIGGPALVRGTEPISPIL